MRLVYALTSPLTKKTDSGEEELRRRRGLLASWATPAVEIDVWEPSLGPVSIESAYEESLPLRGTAELVLRANREGYDAMILGCFGDPQIDALRELSDRCLVVAPGETSCLVACMLGETFGIVTLVPELIRLGRHQVARMGLTGRLAGISAVDMPLLDLIRDREAALSRVSDTARVLVTERGADVIVLGCMSMGFHGFAREVEDRVGVPVVNPPRTAVRAAEALFGCELRQSQAAYPTPKRLVRDGNADLASLLIS